MPCYKHILLLICLFSFSVYAQDIKISETNAGVTIIHIDNSEKYYLDSTEEDINNLANSTEFEIYKVDENGSVHTIFESPAGICYGFTDEELGVDVTDYSSHYLRPNNSSEYYGRVIGMTLTEEGDPRNVQYTPIYIIHNSEKAKQIWQNESKSRADSINQSATKNKGILTERVCERY